MPEAPLRAVLARCSRLGFEASDAVVVGDKASDVELGSRVGATHDHPDRAGD